MVQFIISTAEHLKQKNTCPISNCDDDQLIMTYFSAIALFSKFQKRYRTIKINTVKFEYVVDNLASVFHIGNNQLFLPETSTEVHFVGKSCGSGIISCSKVQP